jgi:predicted phage terminase large subunit-like protein
VFDARRARAVLRELELRRARNSLAVYSGLMIPSEVERDEDLPGQEKLTLAARYVPAEHHRLLISKLEAVERGEIKRLMVFMPPGSAKSTYCSVLFPAWYLGRHPDRCVLQGSYNGDLAQRFGRRARNTFKSPEHFEVFGVGLAPDSKAAGEWTTEKGGEYFAFGMRTGVTGRRANGVILDDAIKGRKEADSDTERGNVWETYRGDVRTRMKPGAWLVYIATRWHEDDPAGRILPADWNGESGWVTAKDGERWYVVCLPAVIETEDEARKDPLKRALGDILWPEWFTPEMFAQEKIIQGTRNWNALYQQKPSTEEGAILKAAYWREWPLKEPPIVEYVMQCYDTAFEEGEEDDNSARTTWGVFDWHAQDFKKLPPEFLKNPPKNRWNAVLLEHWEDKVQFPVLKRQAKDAFDLYQPDLVLIEKKASGHSLLQELRRGSLPVKPYLPDRSKIGRAHAAAAVFEQGCVWHMRRAWANKVIRQCAQFPNGEYDDTVDTVTMAILRLRGTWHLQLREEEEEDEVPKAKNVRKLYG